ncbi:uncharacterized protein LOC110440376 [Mizuhopecten yessoensis]|uniref:uncharacterized protein LOC110440376 n=1 Tax=Mizuhopecten yessoensis TaxID=6573 RepID=UPI000B45E602|nr:uncharacterized protein LOC110440376 [Mizuhopecten yessoensis]XP_021339097.1 uncharacterized protein LOC110440376 [Mizuhopecten yessoensis]XP_021339098.1 uncharacterized protein LOC110440376 [Mizuhopecten yessoensis]
MPPTSQTFRLCCTRLLSQWKARGDVSCICPAASDDMVWWCDDDSNSLIQMTSKGDVYQEVVSPSVLTDICLSPTTHNLWAVCSNGSIMELTSGSLISRFNITNQPMSICCTKGDHILVGMMNKLVKFTTDGEQSSTLTTLHSGKTSICSPRRISQCPVTGNIAVLDSEHSIDGGAGKPYVLGLDKDLKELFEYGEPEHNSRDDFQPFSPWDMTYDSMGNLIIADCDNRCLHLLSGNGQYLRCLHNDTGWARLVAVDRGGILWTRFGNQIKRLQYTSV